ncbi:MAG: hypothetical protein HRU09_20335 [Oligoflexales bacterium]|nr:hypothetical protein [Oligoflexales bacterium]
MFSFILQFAVLTSFILGCSQEGLLNIDEESAQVNNEADAIINKPTLKEVSKDESDSSSIEGVSNASAWKSN